MHRGQQQQTRTPHIHCDTQATTAGSPRSESLPHSLVRLLARGDAQLIVALGIDHFMLITVSHVLQINALALRQLKKIALKYI